MRYIILLLFILIHSFDTKAETIRINSGGLNFTADNYDFQSDKYYYGANRSAYTVSKTIDAPLAYRKLYSTGTKCLAGYRATVKNGSYLVKLHFSEFESGLKTGARIFDIAVENQKIEKFDILKATGNLTHKAYVQKFDVDVSDGQMNVQFKTIKRCPIINAVEIIEKSAVVAGMCLYRTHDMKLGDGTPSLTNIFGSYGYKSYAYDGPEYRSMGVAPDGKVALQMNINEGPTSRGQITSRSLGSGFTKALLSTDIWVPEDFEFPVNCAAPSKGRFPTGMWIGDPAYPQGTNDSGGGVTLEEQKAITIRVNREGSITSPQDVSLLQYVYNLNRAEPLCHTNLGEVCSVQCNSTDCYGFQSAYSNPFPRGRWANIKLLVEMNTPGAADGCVTMMIDDKIESKHCGFDLGADRGWKVAGYMGTDYWHCRNSIKQQKWWLSNIKFYTPCN